ncbi:pyrroline-5-carboxylate reductase [Caballeronia sp. J97]|uniref:pyrroline-5-carboxylate reductase n=1 Tax=Caballeronia sp. J97 TaxID=2805429 RepID=UPI002AB18B43|nr:pyrroline-5-carboxylate reductase [Caballeronia sp. J97]
MKVAFVGAGNMASALIGGLIADGVVASDLYAIDPGEVARTQLENKFHIRTGPRPCTKLAEYDAIVLAVKPQIARNAAQALAQYLGAGQLLISISAGVRCADLRRWLNGHDCVVRAMPNTPALIGLGVTGLTGTPGVDESSRHLSSKILGAVGSIMWFADESLLDAVTAVSGSGPGYVFYFIEALQRASELLGLDAKQGRALSVATFVGAAQLAARCDDSMMMLRERVTSKEGTTACAVESFEAHGVKEAIIQGVLAAAARAMAIGEEYGSE